MNEKMNLLRKTERASKAEGTLTPPKSTSSRNTVDTFGAGVSKKIQESQARFLRLLGTPLEDLAPSPSHGLRTGIDKTMQVLEKHLDSLKRHDLEYLRSHLIDLTKAMAFLEKQTPAVAIYGTARSKKAGTPGATPEQVQMYQDVHELGYEIARLLLPERDGAGPGAMEAGGYGFLSGRKALAEGKEKPHSLVARFARIQGKASGVSELSFLSQGSKIELDPSERTFEQKVGKDNEVWTILENFFSRKQAVWMNALFSVVAQGGWGTADELLEVMVLTEQKVLKDPIVVQEGSMWDDFLNVLRKHGVLTPAEAKMVGRFRSPQDLATKLKGKKLVGFEQNPGAYFETVAKDLIRSVVHLSGQPKGVTMVGTAHYGDDRESAKHMEELARLLTQTGTPIRITGAQQTAHAVVQGVKKAKGDLASLQVFARRTDELPNGVSKPRYSFRNVVVQKELLYRDVQPIVFGRPDLESLAILFSELTLIQTFEHPKRPMLLLGKKHWEPILDSLIPIMVEHKLISEEDVELYRVVDTPEEAAQVLKEYQAKEKT